MRKPVLIQISLSDKQLLKRNPPSWGFLFFISFFPQSGSGLLK